VFNAIEVFRNDFRCITMDQRNANNGESTGPVPVDDPWDAFADDQLGLMDHLDIREFFLPPRCLAWAVTNHPGGRPMFFGSAERRFSVLA
jgi:pimeloyl-ACP methyl ester carboxylesterase